MTITPTKPPRLRFLSPLRAAYLKWLLSHTERDIEHAERQVAEYRKEAERLRVELSHRGAL